MPGRGPVVKPIDRRARGSRSDKGYVIRTVEVKPTPQPDLPEGINWHVRTLAWWDSWRDSPLAENFTDHEWLYLTETAQIQNQFWNGNMQVAAELRLRAAKFGLTPEDRARLRIQVTTADVVEERAEAGRNIPSSRGRYSPPQAV